MKYNCMFKLQIVIFHVSYRYFLIPVILNIMLLGVQVYLYIFESKCHIMNWTGYFGASYLV